MQTFSYVDHLNFLIEEKQLAEKFFDYIKADSEDFFVTLELCKSTLLSLSLNLVEKDRIFKNALDLSQRQVEKLLEVFTEEQGKFDHISKKNSEDIFILFCDCVVINLTLARLYGIISEKEQKKWTRELFQNFFKIPAQKTMFYNVVNRSSLIKGIANQW